MTNEAVDDKETVSILMLITPLQHSVVCHDLLETLVSDATLEANKRLGFICSSILEEFGTVDPGTNLFSLTILGCDERSANDVGHVNGR